MVYIQEEVPKASQTKKQPTKSPIKKKEAKVRLLYIAAYKH